MTSPLNHEPSRIDAHIQSLSNAAPSAHAVEAAQLKLARVVASGRRESAAPARRRSGWVAFAVTACAALALILVPFIVSDRGGVAFADVQKHFNDFRTLSMSIEQHAAGEIMPAISVVLDDAGRVRTDVGSEVSVVVSPVEGQVLMLLHSGRSAMRFPIAIADTLPAQDALEWLDELRHFKGIATALTETRQINGETAHGWSLKIADAEIQLWARDDGLPLAMSIGEGLGLDLRFKFDFDAAVDPARLSTDIPVGYTASFGG